MKKTFISAILVLFFSICLFPAVSAAESEADETDWDTCVESFLSDHGCLNDLVALGYYNTITGEEHYYRGDSYMETGSIYKVPLNMVYAEQISNGDLTFDSPVLGVPYSVMQQASLIRSDNYYATLLWQNLGTYMQFRDRIAPYMGVDPETVDPIYYENRFFTAQQVIHCLRVLYDDPDRFPGIIECLLQAEPEDYFCFHEQRVPVAHKYGYIAENGSFYVCDCGICYTEDPILITMFTWDVRLPNNLLADYCTLMCDYADRTRAARLAAGAQTQEPEEPVPLPLSPATEPIPTIAPEAPVQAGSSLSAPLLFLFAALSVLVLGAVILLSIRKRMRFFSGLLAWLLLSAAAAVCILGQAKELLFTKTEGDPQETVTAFFDGIVNGDPAPSYALLADYSSLGLTAVPSDPAEQALYAALRNSYAYSLSGDCSVSGLSAVQQVCFTYLDLSALSSDLQAEAAASVPALVQELPAGQIYNGEGGYREDFIARVYLEAMETVLQHPETYYTTIRFPVELQYREGAWKLLTSDALLTALSGGSVTGS